jgi:signal transduction histidine kinase
MIAYIQQNKCRWYFYILLLFALLQSTTTLRGENNNPLRATLEREVAGKTAMEILRYADNNSFKDLARALVYADIALELAKKKNDLEDVFNTYRDIGFIYEDNNQYGNALKSYLEAEKIAELLKNDIKLLEKVKKTKIEDAKKKGKPIENIDTDEQLKATYLLNVYNDIAIMQRRLCDYKAARQYHTQCLELAKKINYNKWQEYSYNGLGTLYEILGDYDKAVENFLQSLTFSQARQHKDDIVITYGNIANCYNKAKAYDKALENIQLAYGLANNNPIGVNDTARLASTLNSFGEILVNKGEIDEALSKQLQAIEMYQKIGHKSRIINVLISLANVYSLKKDFITTERYLLQCFEYKDNIVNYDYANLYFKLGELYMQQQSLPKARKSFEQGLSMAKKFDFKDIAQKANHALYTICKEQGDMPNALLYLEKSNSINDSLFNQEKSGRIAELQFKFDVEQSEKQIQSLKLRENRMWMIGGAALSLLIVSLLFSISYLRGKNNKVLKAKNTEIKEQNRKLEESNLVLKQFAYAAAHDLKEPLRNIGSFASLLQRRYGKEFNFEANEYMTFISGGIRRMNSLLEDLLQYSTLIAQQPNDEVHNLSEILKEVMYNLHLSIESKNAQIQYPKQLPKLQMSKLHLTQLFQNLISNAIKFSENTPIVKINSERKEQNMLITVEDNGIGIKQEYDNKVFKLFHRLDRTRNVEGTGIGLAICKNIVEKYNGKIWFESEEGAGTRFFISIPMEAIRA